METYKLTNWSASHNLTISQPVYIWVTLGDRRMPEKGSDIREENDLPVRETAEMMGADADIITNI